MAHVRFVTAMLVLCAILAMGAKGAEAQSPAGDPLLVPRGAPGAIRARMLLFEGQLVCQGTACHWQVEQSWILENTDKAHDQTLNLGLSSSAPPATVALSDSRGNLLTPQSSPGATDMQWSWGLRAGSSSDVSLRYDGAPSSSHFVAWHMSGAELSAWGDVESVRIRLTLAALTQEDAFVLVEPSHYAFDGTTLTWDYEGAATIPDHTLVLLAPPTQVQRTALVMQNDYLGLAELLQTIQADAQQAGYVWPNADAEIGAALQLAAAATPDNSEASWALARYYQTQAAQHPELGTNYLVLAARALESVLRIDPTDQAAANGLKQIYAQASRAASQAGDPAGALEYLKLAEAASGAVGATNADQHLVALQWAASLAEQGRPDEAIAQVRDHLSATALADIAHYAPPFSAAETTMLIAADHYQTQVRLQSYGPQAAETRARLAALMTTVEGLQDWSASLTSDHDDLLATMTMTVTSLEQAQTTSAAMLSALHDDGDILSALLCLPWLSLPTENQRSTTPWQHRLIFAQTFDTSALTEVYARQSDYAGWRLAEVRSLAPASEIDRLEQLIIAAAMAEQVTVWHQLPASCYWVVRLDTADMRATEAPVWMVDWDQMRQLQADITDYDWQAIAATAGALLAFAALLTLTVVWRSKPV